MAALQSPFFGEKQNLLALVRKISKCEYPPIPANIYSQQLRLTVANCICANPARRFDARDVLAVAEHMHAHLSVKQLHNQQVQSAQVPSIRQPQQQQQIRRIQVPARSASGGGSVALPPLPTRQNTQL